MKPNFFRNITYITDLQTYITNFQALKMCEYFMLNVFFILKTILKSTLIVYFFFLSGKPERLRKKLAIEGADFARLGATLD